MPVTKKKTAAARVRHIVPATETPIVVTLDNRVHRVLTVGSQIAVKDGLKVTLVSQKDPVTSQPVDFIAIRDAVGATQQIKCVGAFIAPATGVRINVDEDGSHVFDCSIFPSVRRIVMLGANISGDSNYSLMLVNNGTPDPAGRNDVLVFTNTSGTKVIPADEGGVKIPPNTGE